MKTNYITFDIETTGLEPMNDKIICISYIDLNGESHSLVGDDEKHLLQTFCEYLRAIDHLVLVTFNGDQFDLPFLTKRMIINDISFFNCLSCDLRKIVNGYTWSRNDMIKGTLSNWAKILNIEVVTSNGLTMLSYFENKEFSKISDHCNEDVKITKALFDKLVKLGFIVNN